MSFGFQMFYPCEAIETFNVAPDQIFIFMSHQKQEVVLQEESVFHLW